MRDRAMDSTVRGRRVRPVRSRRAALAAVLGLAVLLPPALSACAPEPDAQATRSSLSKVTEPAAPPKAAEKFDAKKHPEPVTQPEYCTAYLVITARGTGEPVGNQLVTPVARRIAEARPGEMLTVDLFYPADTDINEGGTEGVRRLIDQLNVQAEHCPDQRTILLGYSQGAFVIGDALADPKDRLIGETVGQLSPEARERVLAVVLYGDPRFAGGEPYDVGTFTEKVGGILPRRAGVLAPFADRIRDYCVKNDFVCQASDSLDEKGHVSYYRNGMQAEGAAFVIGRLGPRERR